jgi:hypothetical protein
MKWSLQSLQKYDVMKNVLLTHFEFECIKEDSQSSGRSRWPRGLDMGLGRLVAGIPVSNTGGGVDVCL